MMSDQLRDELLAFRKERDWEQFHNLRTLSTSSGPGLRAGGRRRTDGAHPPSGGPPMPTCCAFA